MVLLSFDIEEFDLPMEYGQVVDFDTQIAVSELGLNRLLEVLEREGVVATFYSTAVFMEHISEATRQRLLRGGHEIASHGYYHARHEEADYLRSRLRLEELTGQEVKGFRMPRMQAVDMDALLRAGYSYDSSLHPTYLPGRYNHWDKPRLPHRLANGLWELPASVVPYCRVPLFWLSMHNFPLWLYRCLASYTIRQDDYLNIYLHPWEFANLKGLGIPLPKIMLRNSGLSLVCRLTSLIRYLKAKGHSFGTPSSYLTFKE